MHAALYCYQHDAYELDKKKKDRHSELFIALTKRRQTFLSPLVLAAGRS